MRRIMGLGEIAGSFDGMIIDQFGVIHDGRALYPGAAEALTGLKRAGVKVVIVTNSGKRADSNTQRIVTMGIAREHFVACISSGEIAQASLKAAKAYIIGKDGEDYGLTGIATVPYPRDADVMLILGSNAPKTTLDDYRSRLSGLTLPAICCNPDRWMISPTGLQPAPGAIAALYEEMGGQVTWIGKPYPQIYQAALELLGRPQRVLCIGDSAEHDVAGGRGAGLATLLVQQGVSQDIQPEALEPKPDYVLKVFRW